MSKLTTAERNRLPASAFALPKERKFPITDRSHAINAEARAAHKSPEVQAKVKRKVRALFSTIKVGGK